MSWRYIVDDGVSASFGLAADEALARRQGTGQSPPTLRLYTYRSHCALVGRFQRLGTELHLDFCRENGIAVNRRPTGGGAIIMGADQLGVGEFSDGELAEISALERDRYTSPAWLLRSRTPPTPPARPPSRPRAGSSRSTSRSPAP